ncbi:SDR family NAD(P)-dependent oxidoreductase [Enterobacillus tribolii]|uniref:Acyl transferase domain-containing protein n=1 Tax=Enterobacillus tribolii TaxID=1487935 RepID=A0A370QEN0_9GAMM|nr:SDR family NAD(P)-dependent oxidoreductase [Enterobacillus tribolii]MBW7984116.1 SDR family NAD(P)-dependent oxidoreductase [Enterobacillus tribolii]RDK86823.1 acyl transferase domain-containing protein [Enterobacillus tribolii]
MGVVQQQRNDATSLSERLNQRLVLFIAEQLDISLDKIGVQEPLARYGVNPTRALRLAGSLGAIFPGVGSTFIFKNRTIQSITDHFLATRRENVHAWLGDEPETNHVFSAAKSAGAVPDLAGKNRQNDPLVAATKRYLRELVGRTLGVAPETLKDHTPFNEYGFSSLAVVSIIQELEDIFDELPVTLFFEYYTIERVTDYLRDNYARELSAHFGIPDPDAAETVREAPQAEGVTPSGSAFDIAIIGLDGRYPDAENVTAFWHNLLENIDCITEIPAERWDWRAYFSPEKGVQGKIYGKWGGFIRDADCFDPLFFSLSPYQAEQMDPAERLFMQSAYGALEDAGYTRDTLDPERKIGVFAATTVEEYQPYSLGENLGLFMSNSASIANRVSYFCNFNGPSLTLNTMCSSSLSAIHLACQSLLNGECTAAIAGAVNLSLHPNKYAYLAHKQFLSDHGRCMAFSGLGNGYVPSEGVGAVVLKPLARAIADGDNIYGVIKGSALNHGGKTNGYSVPAPQAQAGVISQALHRSGIDARVVSYVEAHGTGTSLGDPIEIEGLSRAFGANAADKQYCAIGSVKSNIGHCESAAGLAGLTKVLLQMRHETLVKSLHSETLNPGIKFSNTPFFVQRENAPWPRPVLKVNGEERIFPRIAGLSSFGAGGSNAHMIIEEPPVRRRAEPAQQGPVLIVLSAANRDRLRARLLQLDDYLARGEVNLTDLAYTLQIGREAMAARLAVVAGDQPALIASIKAVLADAAPAGSVYQGEADAPEASAEMTANWVAGKKLEKLAACWVQGAEVDWNALYPDERPFRLSLPTYPFARERYWLPPLAAEPNGKPGRLHPLVHSNISGVHETGFTTRLTGDEIFLRDHQVHGQGVVPAAAQLEWVFAALMLAQAGGREDLALREVTWLRPLVVESECDVRIGLQTSADGQITFELYGAQDDRRQVYCRGYAVASGGAPAADGRHDINVLRAACRPVANLDEKYAHFSAQGMHYGPSLRALVAVHANEEIVVAEIDVSNSGLATELRGIALIDSALQACAALGGFTRLCLPFAVAQCRASSGGLPEKAYAVVRKAQAEEYDIDLTDEQGRTFIQLSGVSLRFLDGQPSGQEEQLLLAIPGWQEQPLLPVNAEQEWHTWWTLTCEAPVPPELAAHLSADRYIPLTAQGTPAQRYMAYAGQLLALLQNSPALRQTTTPITIQLVTSGEGERGLMQGLAQFLRSIGAEFSHLSIQTVVLDDEPMAAERLAGVLRSEAQQGAPVVRYQGGRRTVLYWLVPEETAPVIPWRDEGVYWITGGLGGLGQQLAAAIAAAVKRPVLILSGRHVPAEQQQSWIDALRAQGARVEIYPLDVSDVKAVARVAAAVMADHGRINGVLHCAGVQRDSLLHNLNDDDLREVMAAKVAGAEALDQALGSLPLDWMLLCSSLAAIQGNLGQSGYAAANAYLDQLAFCRQRQVDQGEKQGLTISVNWPLLSDAGMQLDAAHQALLKHTFGLTAMPAARGIAALPQVFALAAPRVALLHGEPSGLRDWLEPGRTLATPAAGKTPCTPVAESHERREAVTDYLKETLSGVIKLPASRISGAVPLGNYGFDSMVAVAWIQVLSGAFGKLPVSMFFENDSIDELAGYLMARHADKLEHYFGKHSGKHSGKTEAASVAQPSAMKAMPIPVSPPKGAPPPATANGGDIAIIGLSGRYPQAEDIDLFWQNLIQGRDCITEIPPERWDWQRIYDERRGIQGKSYGKWGGFIDGVECFDPLFFQILPGDAEKIDPQERLFLQCAWHAIEDAGYTRANLSGDEEQSVGVFVGIMNEEYQLYTPKIDEAETSPVLQGVSASIANRVSWFCNFRGPSLTVNTMCSSSLTAIHLACQSLHQQECRVAIAGGVNVNIHPNKYLALSETGFLSSQGRCTSFADGGDGYVPSEGVGAVVLKPLARALADGDSVYGVIKGSAVNHGGKTHGYTVPNPQAQTRVIARAIQAAGVHSRAISYLEAHGTGTALGDPIEIGGLAGAFAAQTTDKQFCAIGSVKSNIGHCESAAGIAGLTKILLQMRHGQLVASLHSDVINPHIDFADTPFSLVRENRPWPRPRIALNGDTAREYPRLAGLSSFGAGGANAHLIVEEYQSPGGRETAAMPVIIVLSARTATALLQQASQLADYLERRDVNLTDVAWTLQTGREEMAHRLALLAVSRQMLTEKLRAVIAGEQDIANCYTGELKRENGVLSVLNGDDDLRQLSAMWIEKRKLGKLAGLWVQGIEIDWGALYGEHRPQRLNLPGYPFARERCWITPPAEKTQRTYEKPLHPLVHRNTSTLERQRYSTYLTGREWFLKDHQVQGQAVVPGVVQLEWARAAVSLALESKESIQLKQVTWLRPLAVNGEMTVHIALRSQPDGTIDYEIYADGDDACIYGRGSAVISDQPAPAAFDVPVLLARCDTVLDHDVLYAGFARAGLHYGPALRRVSQVRSGEGIAIGELLPAAHQHEAGYFWPVDLLDAALQSSAGLLTRDELQLPIAVGSVISWDDCPVLTHALIRPASNDTPTLRKWDIALTDDEGRIGLQLLEVTLRRATATPDESAPAEPMPVAVSPPGDTATIPLIEQALSELIAGHLALPAEELDRNAPFAEFGFDSINLGTLGNELNERYGLALSTTIFFEAPTIAALAARLADEHGQAFTGVLNMAGPEIPALPDQPSPAPSWRHPVASPAPAAAEPIAVIGMSGSFPQSPDIGALWANLLAGTDCIGEIPPARWHTHSGPRHAGILDNVAGFDPLFFGISPREATSMDPQQRLLMMYVHHVLEDAGYSTESLSGSNTALLVGTGSTGYGQLLAQAGEPIAGYSTAGLVGSIGPNRMSYWLNWHGPSEPVETSCSSSLVAIHRAMALLRSGQCDQAVVGGVNTLMSPDAQQSFAEAGMLSADGRCKPFSAAADGYVRSEGVGMLMLKPLAAARRDGDHIYGLLLGSAENHGGRAASLTSPNPNSQAGVIEAAFRQGGVDPATVSYIETHGTGTLLGDPIEIMGLRQAFGALGQNQQLPVAGCGLGSVKSNIGHTELAAGVAGVIKVLLQMRHRQLVASLRCEPANPQLALAESPFRLVSRNQPWHAVHDAAGNALPRRAGVSSFGFGGVNAHVVMEEYPAAQHSPTPAENPVLIVLSAQSEGALGKRIAQLRDYLHSGPQNLADLAYTLQVGRDAMKMRLALIADDQQTLVDKLSALLSPAQSVAGVWRGTAENLSARADAAVGPWLAAGDLRALGGAWVNGARIDWHRLYTGQPRPMRLSLPTYPFELTHYWPQPVAAGRTHVLHPLIERNTSDLNEQRYTTMLNGNEWFLRDHRVNGRAIVPGAVLLEWARAAACLAAGVTGVSLYDVAWVRPLTVARPVQIHIALEPQPDGRIGFEIYGDDAADDTAYCQGYADTSPQPDAPDANDSPADAICLAQQVIESDEFYARIAAMGLDLGDSLRVVQRVCMDGSGALSELDAGALYRDGYGWLPSLLDGAMQTVAAFAGPDAGIGYPFALRRIAGRQTFPTRVWVRVKPAQSSAGGVRKWDIALYDEHGKTVLTFDCVSFREAPVRATVTETATD